MMILMKVIPVVIPAAILHPMRPSPLVCPELSTYTRFTGSYAPILQREFKVSSAIVAVVVIIAIVAIVVIIIIRPDGRESHLPLQAGHNPTVQGGRPLVPHYRDQSSQLRVFFVMKVMCMMKMTMMMEMMMKMKMKMMMDMMMKMKMMSADHSSRLHRCFTLDTHLPLDLKSHL